MRNKQPNKNSRFSVAVVSSDAGITYRLARRDFRNKLHFTWRTFKHGMDEREMAAWLWEARKELLRRVDAVELELLGMTGMTGMTGIRYDCSPHR